MKTLVLMGQQLAAHHPKQQIIKDKLGIVNTTSAPAVILFFLSASGPKPCGGKNRATNGPVCRA